MHTALDFSCGLGPLFEWLALVPVPAVLVVWVVSFWVGVVFGSVLWALLSRRKAFV